MHQAAKQTTSTLVRLHAQGLARTKQLSTCALLPPLTIMDRCAPRAHTYTCVHATHARSRHGMRTVPNEGQRHKGRRNMTGYDIQT